MEKNSWKKKLSDKIKASEKKRPLGEKYLSNKEPSETNNFSGKNPLDKKMPWKKNVLMTYYKK